MASESGRGVGHESRTSVCLSLWDSSTLESPSRGLESASSPPAVWCVMPEHSLEVLVSFLGFTEWRRHSTQIPRCAVSSTHTARAPRETERVSNKFEKKERRYLS